MQNWSGTVYVLHPCSQIGFKDLVDVGLEVEFDVVTCLNDVDAIIHVQISLSLDRDFETIVDHIHKDIGGVGIGSGDGKVVILSHKQDPFTVDGAGV